MQYMSWILIYVIIHTIILCLFTTGILFFVYKWLKKYKFNLDGFEIFLYKLITFVILIAISLPTNISFLWLITSWLIIVWIFYYVVKMIKLKKYTEWWIILTHLIFVIINIIILIFLVDNPKYSNFYPNYSYYSFTSYYIIFNVGTVIFLLLINGITFIIRKLCKVKKDNINTDVSMPLYKNKKGIIMLILITIVMVFYVVVTNKIKENQQEQKEKKVQKLALNAMTKKYGNGNFQVHKLIDGNSKCNNLYCADYNIYIVVLKSEYMNSTFEVRVFKDDHKLITDNFYNIYMQEKYKMDLEKYLKTQILEYYNKLFLEYNVNINFENIYVNNDYYDVNFGKIPTIEDLKNYVTLESSSIVINKVFDATMQDEFIEYIKKVSNIYYENLSIYNINEDIMDFSFAYDNPFNNGNIHYQKGGYVRRAGNFLDIYLTASPITIFNN